MDDPSPDLRTRAFGCHGWSYLIVVVAIAVPAILSATGVCAAT